MVGSEVKVTEKKIIEFREYDKNQEYRGSDIDKLVSFLENRQREISKSINDYDGCKDFEAGMARIITEVKNYRKAGQKQA